MLLHSSIRSGAGIGAIVIIAIGVMGCEFKGGVSPDNERAPGSAWRPQPVAIRIYPATRFVQDEGHFILEARIELLDEMGDSAKGAGSLAFELLEGTGPLGRGVGKRLYTWDVHLLRLEDQQRHFDPIIRGYLFRLRLDDLGVAGHDTVLRVLFMPADGKRLHAQDKVRRYQQ